MSGRFVRASSYRHVFGTAAKKEQQFSDIRPLMNGNGHYIAANTKFFCYMGQGGGGPVHLMALDKPGRQSANPPKLSVHKAAVVDFAFSPFQPTLLATGAEDCYVKVTRIPEEGLTKDINEADATLEGHNKKLNVLKFHPTSSNVLASVSYDNTVKIWDIEKQQAIITNEDHADTIYSAEWSLDGAMMATSSKDNKVRILDPRKQGSAVSGEGFPGSKSSEVMWLNNHGKVAVIGFNKNAYRQYAIYDPKNFDKPLTTVDIDQSAGVLMPFYDEDNSILYVAGKGDSGIKYFEAVDQEPYLHFLSEFRDKQPQKGLCFLPKVLVDTKKCEIAVALRLMRDSVVPVSFQVPRKSDVFQKDIYPDTYAYQPSQTADDYFRGKNAAPIFKSLDPKQGGAERPAPARPQLSAAASGGSHAAHKAEPAKPVPSEQPKYEAQAPAHHHHGGDRDLQKELDSANERIRELEEEVARLRSQ